MPHLNCQIKRLWNVTRSFAKTTHTACRIFVYEGGDYVISLL